MWLALSVLLPSAWAVCPADPGAFRHHLDESYSAYLAFDLDKFNEHAKATREELPCLAGAVDAETAARAHLIAALSAGLDNDLPRALAAFRGLRTADANFVLDPNAVPEGSDARAAFQSAGTLGPGVARKVTPAESVTLYVDGRPGAETIPTERASLVQAEVNGVFSSWYLAGGAAFPAELEARFGTPDRRSPTRALAVSSIGAAALAGVSFGVTRRSLTRFEESTDALEVRATWQQERVFYLTGVGFSAAALGLGAGAVLTGRW